MERLTKFREQVSAFWSQLTTMQKGSFAAVLVAAVAGFGWIVFSATQPEWRVLYGDLDEATASKITEELTKRQIPHKLINANTISVPRENVYEARLQIAGTGITDTTSAGYELFDEADFGMTAFTQKVNYKRAMENELARTVRAIRSVKDARVHLVMPEDSLFKDDQRPATASVVLKLENAAVKPNTAQIQSIQHLVASAVEGMSPESVTIVDQEGRLLARPTDSGMAQGSSDALENAQKMAMSLEERVVQLLSPVVGASGVRAKVNIDIDTKRVVETAETFDPEQTAVRSEQRSEQSSSDAATAAGGVPGIGANLPNRNGAGGAAANKASNNVEEVTNYEVSKTVRQTTQDGFSVSRVSVAVLLDAGAMVGPDGKAVDPARIESLVKSAVGFDAARNDSVEITVEPFLALDAEEPAVAPWMEPDVIVPTARYATFALLALMLFLFVVRPFAKSIKELGPLPKEAPEHASRSIEVEVVGRRVGDIDAEAELVTDRVEGRSYPQLRTEIIDMSKADLEKTALILRQWIRSDAA
ncbi:MAG: flagellar basal-body MS-ring/collar protein FliF [bacterium]